MLYQYISFSLLYLINWQLRRAVGFFYWLYTWIRLSHTVCMYRQWKLFEGSIGLNLLQFFFLLHLWWCTTFTTGVWHQINTSTCVSHSMASGSIHYLLVFKARIISIQAVEEIFFFFLFLTFYFFGTSLELMPLTLCICQALRRIYPASPLAQSPCNIPVSPCVNTAGNCPENSQGVSGCSLSVDPFSTTPETIGDIYHDLWFFPLRNQGYFHNPRLQMYNPLALL